jgi:hypothetical protein
MSGLIDILMIEDWKLVDSKLELLYFNSPRRGL